MQRREAEGRHDKLPLMRSLGVDDRDSVVDVPSDLITRTSENLLVESCDVIGEGLLQEIQRLAGGEIFVGALGSLSISETGRRVGLFPGFELRSPLSLGRRRGGSVRRGRKRYSSRYERHRRRDNKTDRPTPSHNHPP